MSRDRSPDLDLGEGHTLRYTCWHPDRDLNPQYAHLPDVERYAAIIRHALRADDALPECQAAGFCEGVITFDGPVQRELSPGPFWQVQAWEPLTCSPSLLCHCGDHGFIQAGRWVTTG